MGLHYFKVNREGIKGLMLISGTVADLNELVKEQTKKVGLEMQELSQEEADKEKTRLEV